MNLWWPGWHRRIRRSAIPKTLHRPKIAIAVQQGVAALDTEGADNEVDRLADRDPPAAQESVVHGRFDRQLRIEQRDGLETPQRPFDESRLRLIPQTLQDLE